MESHYHHGGIRALRFEGRKKTSKIVMFSVLRSRKVQWG